MQAIAVFPAKHLVTLIDHPEPRLVRPTQVKYRMLEVGVCGTDRDIATFRYGDPPPGSDYLVLGHESFAEVAEAGPESGLTVGDTGVLTVRHACDHADCDACRAGRQDFCASGGYHEHGIKEIHGFMTEYLVEDASHFNPVPSHLRDAGVLVEPLSIAEKAYLQYAAIERRLPWRRDRQTAVVLGAGPVGLLGAMVLRHAGFRVFVYSRSRKPNPKAAIADAIGAEYISSLDLPPHRLLEKVGRIDVVYEAVGAAQIAFDVLKTLGSNGVFIFTGVPGRADRVAFDTHRTLLNMVIKNQIVMGTVNAGQDAFDRAIVDLAAFREKWPAALAGMITGRFSLADYREPVFHPNTGIKSVIRMR